MSLSHNGILDAGVDYLRLTIPRTNAGYDEGLEILQNLQKDAQKRGHKRKPFGFSGYEGFLCDRYYFGKHERGIMLQASGCGGNVLFDALREVEIDGTITRLDAQTTISPKAPGYRRPEQVRGAIRRATAKGKTPAFRTSALFESAGEQNTYYMGSFSSGSFVRLYVTDTCHNNVYPTGAVRAEVQHNKETAGAAFDYFRKHESLTISAVEIVRGKLNQYGVRAPWAKCVCPAKPFTSYLPTTDEKSLEWLDSHVAATIHRLLKNGHHDRLCSILGVKALELSSWRESQQSQKSRRLKLTKGGML
jgi:DNA relaxase NicK